MSNARQYYAIHALAFAPHGVNYDVKPTGYVAMHGGQSVGTTVSFNLNPINEIGQVEIYENVEGIPNVELTAQKVLDGYPLIQHLASQTPAGTSSLNGRYNDARCNVIAAYYSQSENAASGTPLTIAFMSGMYVSSINFNIPVEGSATESVTLVGNNKTYDNTSLPTGLFTPASRFNNADAPQNTGLIQQREDVDMLVSRWPQSIPGISSSGTNNYVNGQYLAHIQNVTVSVDLGRTELFELGRRGPYYRYAEFPTRVTCTIEITTNEYGDDVPASEESTNLTNEEIKIAFVNGTVINLGTANKLESVSTTGGDATGGNMTTTYSYFNYNSLTVTQRNQDFL